MKHQAVQLARFESLSAGHSLEMPVFGEHMGDGKTTASVKVQCRQSDQFKEGFEAGLIEASKSARNPETAIAAACQSLAQQAVEIDGFIRREATASIAKLFSAIAPDLARAGVLAQIETLVGDHTEGAGNGDLQIKLHSDLGARLGEMTIDGSRLSDAVSLTMDDSMPVNAFEARWSGGGAIENIGQLITKIQNCLAGEHDDLPIKSEHDT